LNLKYKKTTNATPPPPKKKNKTKDYSGRWMQKKK
jgi:hypothetical protein